MYVRVYEADMVCRLIETCFLIHILRSISKVLGASSFCTCVEYIIMKTCPCNVYLLEPHFYIANMGYIGVNLFFLFLLHNID